MIKKEVLEIRKQFTQENCTISRICGCYVDFEKNKKTELKEAFLSLPEEEIFKYFKIFRQTLSGTLGRNLMNLDFPLDTEKEGGPQEFLLRLRNSRLQDDMLLEEFYDKVIEAFPYAENYLIILIHSAYDVPGRSSDNLEMYDASDSVFDYIMCSICPVNLSKPGLCYNEDTNNIQNRSRDWLVEDPMKGFVFPAFNDRAADIHSVLYYSKKPEELLEDFIDQLLGCSLPLSADNQKETFNTLIANTLGDDCDYEVVKNIHENLNELIEVNKDAPEPLELSKFDVKKLLEISGVPDERMETFEEDFDNTAGEKTSLLASNIASVKKFNIQTPDIVIKVNPERTDLIETKIIDGKQCLVIVVDDHIEVNGVNVRTIRQVADAPLSDSEYPDNSL